MRWNRMKLHGSGHNIAKKEEEKNPEMSQGQVIKSYPTE